MQRGFCLLGEVRREGSIDLECWSVEFDDLLIGRSFYVPFHSHSTMESMSIQVLRIKMCDYEQHHYDKELLRQSGE